MPVQGAIERFSTAASEWTGSTAAFTLAVLVTLAWIVTGPFFHFSDAWQLVINSFTNIVTFLMVFLIQPAQNKGALALQLKVNELIATQRGAHNALIAIDQLSEEQLRALQVRFTRLAQMAAGTEPLSVHPPTGR
jgi:low affinity Fe/Cu permease